MTPAEHVARAVAHPLLDPHKTLRLVTTSARVSAWVAAGADLDLIVAVVGGVMRKRSDPTPVRAWGYFDEPIRQAIADKAAMESFDATVRTGPSAARARRSRAADAVLQELGELEVVPGTAAD